MRTNWQSLVWKANTDEEHDDLLRRLMAEEPEGPCRDDIARMIAAHKATGTLPDEFVEGGDWLVEELGADLPTPEHLKIKMREDLRRKGYDEDFVRTIIP